MEQCKAYYEALERGDGAQAHLLFVRPSQTSFHILMARSRMEQLRLNYEAEQKRIEEMSPEMLRIEIELLYK